MTLESLAIKYVCDKYYSHSYIPVYEDLFRDRNVRRLLEIGIGYEDLMKPFVPRYVHGASLRMWEEYWPKAEIFGCDIREETLINEGRIHSMICDQSKVALLRLLSYEFRWPFDVIIDDGSHQVEHQLISYITLKEYLSESGVYVIEDVSPDTAEFLGGRLNGKIIHGNKRPDDCLVVIQK